MEAPIKMSLQDRLPFGKYKGCTVDSIIAKDVDYLSWAINNQIIELDNNAYHVYARNLEE